MTRMTMAMTVCLLLPAVAVAGISYDAANGCFHVVDFPQEAPATYEDVLRADRRHGWNKATYDEASDTYVLNAALWIGEENGYSTHFQIGTPAHRDVTVVMHGSIWVRPAVKGIRRTDGSPSVMNGLTIGDSQDPAVKPRIQFLCTEKSRHGLFAGYRKGKVFKDTSRLRIFNTVITSPEGFPWGGTHYQVPGNAEETYTLGAYTRDFRLENCRFTNFKGCLFYGVQSAAWDRHQRAVVPREDALIRDCVFEHGGSAVAAYQYVTDCEFRDLHLPISGSSVSVRAVRCVFENNEYNWRMEGYASRDMTLLDCRVGPQKQPMRMKPNKNPNPARGVPYYPSVRIMRSVRIKALDADGRPVPMASVATTGNGSVLNPQTFTGTEGMTAKDPEQGAIAVTVKRITATDDPEAPEVYEDFHYAIRVSARQTVGSASLDSRHVPDSVVIRLP